jgi:hypothetical protein
MVASSGGQSAADHLDGAVSTHADGIEGDSCLRRQYGHRLAADLCSTRLGESQFEGLGKSSGEDCSNASGDCEAGSHHVRRELHAVDRVEDVAHERP